jgi:signal transduction histidine kinase
VSSRPRFRFSWSLASALAVGVCLSVAVLAWFGYQAIYEWQKSSALLADRQAKEAANLLVTTLTRDMQAVQHSVLLSEDWDQFTHDTPHRAFTLVAGAFARYPYPESFFAWRRTPSSELPVFFNRRDRPPPRMPVDDPTNHFPVIVGYDAPGAADLLRRIRVDAANGQSFSVFETVLRGTRYQVVAHLLYQDSLRQELGAVAGFTVNLEWVHQHYFRELTQQFMRIGTAEGLAVAIVDSQGRLVAGTSRVRESSSTSRRAFSPWFFDPLLVAADVPGNLSQGLLTVESAPADDSPLVAAAGAANRMLILGAFAAGALALGLVLTVGAVHASAELAELRSEFVSTVTHELKAPMATIRAAGETLIAGRVRGETMQRDYARLIVQETKRLTHLVDNLLAFSRVTDTAAFYSFELLALDALVTEALDRHRLQLADAGFEPVLAMSSDVPLVRVDRTAMALWLDNLIDNAVRHSGDSRHLQIGVRAADGMVQLEVCDRGRGIAKDEVDHVTRKFFRGRNAGPGGTGLGLAIAKRIATDHHGALTVGSAMGVGTTVTLTLPAVAAKDRAIDTPVRAPAVS